MRSFTFSVALDLRFQPIDEPIEASKQIATLVAHPSEMIAQILGLSPAGLGVVQRVFKIVLAGEVPQMPLAFALAVHVAVPNFTHSPAAVSPLRSPGVCH